MARKRLRPKEDDSQVAEVEVVWARRSPLCRSPRCFHRLRDVKLLLEEIRWLKRCQVLDRGRDD